MHVREEDRVKLPTSRLTCDRRNAVPRPASNCSFTALQSPLSSP
jgi:hypothetical protein